MSQCQMTQLWPISIVSPLKTTVLCYDDKTPAVFQACFRRTRNKYEPTLLVSIILQVHVLIQVPLQKWQPFGQSFKETLAEVAQLGFVRRQLERPAASDLQPHGLATRSRFPFPLFSPLIFASVSFISLARALFLLSIEILICHFFLLSNFSDLL